MGSGTDVEIYIQGDTSEPHPNHWMNAEKVLVNCDWFIEAAILYATQHNFRANTGEDWSAMGFGFGAPGPASIDEFYITLEHGSDVYGLWAVWFIRSEGESPWRAHRLSRQDW